MEIRDVEALLKAIKQAQDPVLDMFSGKNALALDFHEERAVKEAQSAISNGLMASSKVCGILLSIYKRAYS